VFNHIPSLFVLLAFLLSLSVFFSLAETALLSVNRYRIRHLVRHKHHLAKRVQELLERPDRMLGVILLCDTFADILASAIATLIAIHYLGDKGVVVSTICMTVLVLIFGEIAPKTLATMYPQKIAFFSAWPLIILLRFLYPFVWFVNSIANGLLRLFGIKVRKLTLEHLSHEEFATLLREAGGKIPADYQHMLLKILDLEKVTVEDIMVPRNEITGIDISEDWDTILAQLTTSQYTRLPVYDGDIDQVVGILHLRKIIYLLEQEKLDKESLLEATESIYFIPEGTSLNIQLLNFRYEKRRLGFVVDEYGEIQGLLTLEDILEEIVGEFTSDLSAITDILLHPQPDGSYLVDGSINIRDLNRLLHCQLPTTGPKTLSGLIIEYLEAIPQSAIALRMDNLILEIVQVKDNVIKKVRITPEKMKLENKN